MIAEDEAALICDFAQYYNVFDYKQLPVQTAAVLACGLPEESRIMRKISKNPYTYEQVVLAGIFDTVNAMAYSRIKKNTGTQQPESLLKKMFPGEKKEEQIATFKSGNEFEEMRRKIAERAKK